MTKIKKCFCQLLNVVRNYNSYDFRGHEVVYTGLHDPAAFKGIYLDCNPCIFVMYVRNANFILLRLDLERI
jgi:hypothetical protein